MTEEGGEVRQAMKVLREVTHAHHTFATVDVEFGVLGIWVGNDNN